ncbi:MAG: CopG family transcriptional regulator [Verrucomicrobiota bacterium]
MQTTLRIDDRLYREAKAEAARAGLSLTRFLEEGLRLRLEKRVPDVTTPHAFRVYATGRRDARPWEDLRRIADDEQEAHDLAQLGIIDPKS